ncbi:MAG: hypothetical protein ACRC5A_12345 [Enterobacteriaceae bacterium]
MPALRFIGFIGEIPRLLPRLLPEMASRSAFNVRLSDGGLTPVRENRLVHHFSDAPEAGYQTIYRHKRQWLAWRGVVHAVPGPVAQDRLYLTGDGRPKVRVGNTFYDLAVKRPDSALKGEATGEPIKDEVTTRLYVYTQLRVLPDGVEEESEPSPASNEILWKPGQRVQLTGFTAPEGISKQRIYRMQNARFYFIAERPASPYPFIDDIPLDNIVEPLRSTSWNAPPDTLSGLIALPNGMMAGFTGKTLCFCEPWYPHAWPEKYQLTTDYPIVGLGAYASTLVVMTTGNPYIVSGTSPDSMVMERTEVNLPCINARGIVDLGYTIAYPSTHGLVVASQSGAQLATMNLITAQGWQQLNPPMMIAGQINGRYLARYQSLSVSGRNRQGVMLIDISGEQPYIIRTDDRPEAFWYDIESSALYFLEAGNVYEWDAPGRPARPLSWTSRQIIMPKPCNFGAIRTEKEREMSEEEIAAIKEKEDEARAYNQAVFAAGKIQGEFSGTKFNTFVLNGDALRRVLIRRDYVLVNVYAGKERRLVASITRTGRPARLPSGFTFSEWEIEVGANTTVTQITLATTMTELAQ